MIIRSTVLIGYPWSPDGRPLGERRYATEQASTGHQYLQVVYEPTRAGGSPATGTENPSRLPSSMFIRTFAIIISIQNSLLPMLSNDASHYAC